jgi:hypothetical protein
MPILHGLLSHQTVGTVCVCYLSLCSICSLRNILFVSLGLVIIIVIVIVVVVVSLVIFWSDET